MKIEIVELKPVETFPRETLIMHIAESEYYWIQEIVSGKPMTAAIVDLLHHDLWFKDFAAEDLDVAYCLEVVEKIHVMTRNTLSKFTDGDIEKLFARKREDKETYYSLRWIFVHLLQHDAEHQGQIMMIKRLVRKG
jgi:uncharacterized damage-inducible protein DinB